MTRARTRVGSFLARLATAGAVVAGGVLAVAMPAAASPAVAAAHWQIYQVYKTSDTCQEVGKALLAKNVVDGYKCEWDSPGFALYVKY